MVATMSPGCFAVHNEAKGGGGCDVWESQRKFMLFEHRARKAKDCGRESWGALEAAINASVCSGGALSDGVCFW